jgi:hypothetical protein
VDFHEVVVREAESDCRFEIVQNFAIADCVADCVRLAVQQAIKWQYIGNEINTARSASFALDMANIEML